MHGTEHLCIRMVGRGPYGMRLAENDQRQTILVSKLHKKGKSHSAGVEVHDVVLAINGLSCQHMNVDVARELITSSNDPYGLTLHLLRGQYDAQSLQAAFDSIALQDPHRLPTYQTLPTPARSISRQPEVHTSTFYSLPKQRTVVFQQPFRTVQSSQVDFTDRRTPLDTFDFRDSSRCRPEELRAETPAMVTSEVLTRRVRPPSRAMQQEELPRVGVGGPQFQQHSAKWQPASQTLPARSTTTTPLIREDLPTQFSVAPHQDIDADTSFHQHKPDLSAPQAPGYGEQHTDNTGVKSATFPRSGRPSEDHQPMFRVNKNTGALGVKIGTWKPSNQPTTSVEPFHSSTDKPKPDANQAPDALWSSVTTDGSDDPWNTSSGWNTDSGWVSDTGNWTTPTTSRQEETPTTRWQPTSRTSTPKYPSSVQPEDPTWTLPRMSASTPEVFRDSHTPDAHETSGYLQPWSGKSSPRFPSSAWSPDTPASRPHLDESRRTPVTPSRATPITNIDIDNVEAVIPLLLKRVVTTGNVNEVETAHDSPGVWTGGQSKRKLFADSAFYADPEHNYPTIEEQFRIAHKVALLLTSPANSNARGQKMFLKRREQATKWTTDEKTMANLISKVPQNGPRRAPRPVSTDQRVVQYSRIMTPEEVERMRYLEEKSHHDVISYAVCSRLADELKRGTPDGRGKATEMFAKRRERVDKYVVQPKQTRPITNSVPNLISPPDIDIPSSRRQPQFSNRATPVKTPEPPPLVRTTPMKTPEPPPVVDSPPMSEVNPPVNRLVGMLNPAKPTMSPWESAVQYGHVERAFEHLRDYQPYVVDYDTEIDTGDVDVVEYGTSVPDTDAELYSTKENSVEPHHHQWDSRPSSRAYSESRQRPSSAPFGPSNDWTGSSSSVTAPFQHRAATPSSVYRPVRFHPGGMSEVGLEY